MKRLQWTRPLHFWEKGVLIGTGIFVMFTCAQMYYLQRLDAYLGSQAVSEPQLTNGSKSVEKPKLTYKAEMVLVPSDAKMYVYRPDNAEIAYVNGRRQLVIANDKQVLFKQAVGDVTNLRWLGDSGTLLYFVQGTELNAYLVQQNQQRAVLIGQLPGTHLTIKNIYFSPYLEYMYIELDHGGYDAIYKYDAEVGMKQLSLGYVKISNITYNAKQDMMTITDSGGTVWHYEYNQLMH